LIIAAYIWSEGIDGFKNHIWRDLSIPDC